MNCQTAIELLPWLLNRTLDSEERRAVEEHLVTCDTCRRELAETRAAAEIYRHRVPGEALVAQAEGRPVEGVAGPTLESMLATDSETAEEMALVRASYRALHAGDVPAADPDPAPNRRSGVVVTGPWVRRAWRTAALAASLVGAVALGGWLWSLLGHGDLERRLVAERETAEERIESLEKNLAEVQAADGDGRRVAELEAEIDRLRAGAAAPAAPIADQVAAAGREENRIRINAPPISLAPIETVTRGTEDEPAAAERPAVDATAERLRFDLTLPSQSRSYDRLRIALVDASGDRLRQVDLPRTDDYYLDLEIENAALPPGVVTLEVYGLGAGEPAKLASYRVEAR